MLHGGTGNRAVLGSADGGSQGGTIMGAAQPLSTAFTTQNPRNQEQVEKSGGTSAKGIEATFQPVRQ